MLFIRKHPLFSYFILAYLLTWSVSGFFLLSARGLIAVHIPEAIEGLAAFGPFAAALLVLWVTRGKAGVSELFSSLTKWRVSTQWFAFACLSPFAVLLAALVITGATGQLFSGKLFGKLVTEGSLIELIVIGGILQGLGEEPGWRGLALPILRKRFGPLLASLALFPVWLFWHLPAFLARPEFQLGAWIGFSAGIFAAAIWCTFIYDATRSVLMVVIWHALINITRGAALAVSTGAFLAFGQIVLAVAIIIAVYWMLVRPSLYTDKSA